MTNSMRLPLNSRLHCICSIWLQRYVHPVLDAYNWFPNRMKGSDSITHEYVFHTQGSFAKNVPLTGHLVYRGTKTTTTATTTVRKMISLYLDINRIIPRTYIHIFSIEEQYFKHSSSSNTYPTPPHTHIALLLAPNQKLCILWLVFWIEMFIRS
jgi:hypothetical protein